jgi:hypothetical protein
VAEGRENGIGWCVSVGITTVYRVCILWDVGAKCVVYVYIIGAGYCEFQIYSMLLAPC